MSGSRLRSRRLGAVLATALFTIALVPGLATAADTRILWIGAPELSVDANNDDIPDNSGKLFVTTTSGQLPTKVSKPDVGKGPYATMFQVEILNSGGQNLAHTILTINADAQGSLRCPIVPPATEPSATCLDTEKVSPRCPIVPPATEPSATCLDSLKLATFYDPDPIGDDASSTFCSTDGDTITCDYGSLVAGASRTVAVVVNVTDAYDADHQVTPLFAATVTTNNENGQNTQTFSATSGPQVDANGVPIPGSPAFTVDGFGANTLSTFVLNDVVGENLSTSDVNGLGGNKLKTFVSFDTTNKELVQINEGSSTSGFYQCPLGVGLNCQVDYSEVTTTSGFFSTTPFFTWTLTAIVPKTYSLAQGFVAHYPAGATAYLFNHEADGYWTLLFKSKSSLCGTDVSGKIEAQGHCILGTPTLTKNPNDKNTNVLVVTVVMDHQGGLKY